MNFIPSVQQQAVADWANNESGHLNLIARAECGKTSTLLWLVPQLQGQCIFLAFNKSISDEVKFKLNKQSIDWKKCEACTFHSIGMRAWKKSNRNVIVNEYKVRDLIESESKRFLIEGNEKTYNALSDCIIFLCKLISLAKQQAFGHLVTIDDSDAWQYIINHHDLEWESEETTEDELINFAKYFYRLSLNSCKTSVDFDDMLLAPLIFNSRMWQYDWVLIDEAQDTNPSRRALAMKLLKMNGRLIAVGDPCQAIYGFTGADVNSMDIIKEQLGSKELPLNITYRCPKNIVAHANNIVPDIVAHETAPDGVVKTIPKYDEKNECFEQYYTSLGPNDSILCRNTKPLITLAYELLGKSVGCMVEGRDIGKGLIYLATRWKRIKKVQALINRLKIYKEGEIQKAMSKGNENKASSIEDKVDTLIIICEKVGVDCYIDDVVNEINKMFGDTKPGTKSKVVTLSTVHKSKGREWNTVYILGRNKYMPSTYAHKDWQINQENNLIYVAITRSKETLIEISVDD